MQNLSLQAEWGKRLGAAQDEAQEQNARQTKQNAAFEEGFDSLRKQLGVVSGDAATLKAEIQETRAESSKHQSLAEKHQRDLVQTQRDLKSAETLVAEHEKELSVRLHTSIAACCWL